jgi:6,7-dimethyl-8-ribityllumazine synthase
MQMAKKKSIFNLSISFGEAKVLIVEGRFYEAINDHLLAGAKAALDAAKVPYDVLTVPGALEIPQAMNIAAQYEDYDGFIALGCVIRGDTGHYDIVANETNAALMRLAMEAGIPLGNGVLTVENEEQAMERAKPDALDKGGDAARACLALISIDRKMSE